MSAIWVPVVVVEGKEGLSNIPLSAGSCPQYVRQLGPVVVVEGKEGLSNIPLSAGSCPQYVGQLGACGCC